MSRRPNNMPFHAATVCTGLAIGFVALGRFALAIVSAALAAIAMLLVLRQLTRGDR